MDYGGRRSSGIAIILPLFHSVMIHGWLWSLTCFSSTTSYSALQTLPALEQNTIGISSLCSKRCAARTAVFPKQFLNSKTIESNWFSSWKIKKIPSPWHISMISRTGNRARYISYKNRETQRLSLWQAARTSNKQGSNYECLEQT